MKNVFLLTAIALISSACRLYAQFEGKQFLSGSASVAFSNTNPKMDKATNGYGYDFDVSIGKFKTNTRASGWKISSALGGGNYRTTIYRNNQSLLIERSGINSFGVGVGKFWQYYKHFNNKIGLFAGPNVDLVYAKGKSYSTNEGSSYFTENKFDKIQLALGLGAGMYYQFSEKWWVTASLAFANPVSIEYSFQNTEASAIGEESYNFRSEQLKYRLSPNFSFPNVGIGLRYFYNR